MSMGLLGSLLRILGGKRRTLRFTKPAPPCHRPFLEGLETRTLPSILIASPKLADTAELPTSGLADNAGLVDDPRGHQDDQQSGQIDGPGDGPQDSQGGKKITPVDVGADILVDAQPDLLGLHLVQSGDGPVDNPQGQDDNGQTSNQGTQGANEGDGQGSNDSGQTIMPGGSQGGLGGSKGAGQSGKGNGSDNGQGNGSTNVQSNSSDNGAPGGAGRGTNAPADARDGPQDGKSDRTKNIRPDGQGDNQNAAGTGDGMNAPANGQGSAPDRKQHGPSSSEGEQRGPGSPSDVKQHAPDGAVILREDFHNLVSSGSQEPEQNNRNQAVAPVQQHNGPMEDPVQRQVEVPPTEAFQRSAVEQVSYPPTEEIQTSLIYDLPEPTVRANDYLNVSPQNYGSLTDSLSLDFSSLRSEVQRFFELIDNLGGHSSERQVGVLLSSGAVVMAAAMACEVARRQARRPAAGSTFALVPTLVFGNEADAPSGIGLPNFGQFSAFS